MPNPVLITGASGRGARRKAFHLINERSAAKNREVLPGFPKETPFKSTEEVRDYLAGDRIECLLCGRFLKSMSKHLTIHGISPRDYKRQFGIPLTYGLTSEESRKKYQAGGKLSSGAGNSAWHNGQIDYAKRASPPEYVRTERDDRVRGRRQPNGRIGRPRASTSEGLTGRTLR